MSPRITCSRVTVTEVLRTVTDYTLRGKTTSEGSRVTRFSLILLMSGLRIPRFVRHCINCWHPYSCDFSSVVQARVFLAPSFMPAEAILRHQACHGMVLS